MNDLANYVCCDTQGRIVQTILTTPWGLESVGLLGSLVQLDEAIEVSLEDSYILEGKLVARPVRPTIPVTGVAPLLLTLPVAAITIANEAADVIEVTGGEVLLRDAGVYTLTVTAPFPQQSFTQRIEVRHD